LLIARYISNLINEHYYYYYYIITSQQLLLVPPLFAWPKITTRSGYVIIEWLVCNVYRYELSKVKSRHEQMYLRADTLSHDRRSSDDAEKPRDSLHHLEMVVHIKDH